LSEGFSGGLFGLGKELLKERRSMVGLAEVTVIVVARCQKQRHLAGEWLESFLDLYPLGLGVVFGQITQLDDRIHVASTKLVGKPLRLPGEVIVLAIDVVLRVRKHRDRPSPFVWKRGRDDRGAS